MTSIKRTALLAGLLLTVAASGCAQKDAPEENAAVIDSVSEVATADTTPPNSTASDAVATEAVPSSAPVTATETATETAQKNNPQNSTAQKNVAAASNRVQSSFQLTDAGIGEVTASTPFSEEAIQSAFPNMTVTTEVQMAEGMEYPVIVALDSSGKALEIEPTMDSKIYRVSATSSQIEGASGHTIGDSFSSIYGDVIPSDCGTGVDAWAGAVICTVPGSENVRYAFEGAWGPLMGQLPSDAELANGTVRAIAWGTGNY